MPGLEERCEDSGRPVHTRSQQFAHSTFRLLSVCNTQPLAPFCAQGLEEQCEDLESQLHMASLHADEQAHKLEQVCVIVYALVGCGGASAFEGARGCVCVCVCV